MTDQLLGGVKKFGELRLIQPDRAIGGVERNAAPEEAVREAAHGLAIGPEDWTWELVLALKARLGVSAETFLYRIEELGMLSRSRNRAFRKILEEHYARCRATGKKDLEPAAPRNAGGRLGALKLRAATTNSRHDPG